MSQADLEQMPELDGEFPPRLCAKIYGQEAVEKRFIHALAHDKLHHAWLLTGAQGIGKASFAYRVAKYMLHHQNPMQAAQTSTSLDIPEGTQAAQFVNQLAHPDFLALTRPYDLKKEAFKAEIPIEETRRIRRFMSLTSGLAKWRVCLIDSADEMTIQAAHSVLKTLEEPPVSTLFLLVSHSPGKLLETIRSRCQITPLSPLKPEIVQQLLQEKRPDMDVDTAAAIAFLSDASIGYALQIADMNGLALYREMIDVLTDMPNPDGVKLHALAERMNGRTVTGLFALFNKLLAGWLHRMMNAAARGQAGTVLFEGESDVMARLMTASRLEEWVEVWEKVSRLNQEAELLNLDRKQTVLESFALIKRAAIQK